MDAEESRRFLEAVRALRGRRAGRPVLQGRHIALLCGGPHHAPEIFGRAVAAAGGSLALLHDATWQPGGGAPMPEAARLLGSLYDAVDACHLPAEACADIEHHACIPVFDGLARPDHPLRLYAAALAMCECAPVATHGGDGRLRVRILGDVTSDRHLSARRAVQAAGLEVEPAGCGDDDCDFVLDPGDDGRAATLGAPQAGAQELQRLAAALRDSEPAVIQAALAGALS